MSARSWMFKGWRLWAVALAYNTALIGFGYWLCWVQP